jgi:hypothetical protein
VSAWIKEKPLQVPSLVESFHDARTMDKLRRTCVPLDGEHVGNVSGGEGTEEDVPRGAYHLSRRTFLAKSSPTVRARGELVQLRPAQNNFN